MIKGRRKKTAWYRKQVPKCRLATPVFAMWANSHGHCHEQKPELKPEYQECCCKSKATKRSSFISGYTCDVMWQNTSESGSFQFSDSCSSSLTYVSHASIFVICLKILHLFVFHSRGGLSLGVPLSPFTFLNKTWRCLSSPPFRRLQTTHKGSTSMHSMV